MMLMRCIRAETRKLRRSPIWLLFWRFPPFPRFTELLITG